MNTTDTTPKHSPEPWKFSGSTGYFIKDMERIPVCQILNANDDFQNWQLNGHRIVTCVNALAGIEDPESYLKQLKEEREQLIEALEESNKILTLCTKERQSIGLFNDTMLTISENEDLLTKLKGEQ